MHTWKFDHETRHLGGTRNLDRWFARRTETNNSNDIFSFQVGTHTPTTLNLEIPLIESFLKEKRWLLQLLASNSFKAPRCCFLRIVEIWFSIYAAFWYFLSVHWFVSYNVEDGCKCTSCCTSDDCSSDGMVLFFISCSSSLFMLSDMFFTTRTYKVHALIDLPNVAVEQK